MNSLIQSMQIIERYKKASFFYNLVIIYWLAIGFIAAYWVLFLLDAGFVMWQVSIIMMMMPISSLIFEVPTGVVADRFGRKVSVFISYLLTAISFIGLIFSHGNIYIAAISYLFVGIAVTFESGALDAWFIDTHKGEKNLNSLLGTRSSFSQIGFIVGSFIAGLLAEYSITGNFVVSAILFFLLSIYVLFFGKETIQKHESSETGVSSFRMVLTTSKRMFSNVQLRILIISTFVMAIAGTMMFNSHQPYMVDMKNMPVSYISYALTASGILALFFINYSDELKTWLGGNRNVLISGFVLASLILVLLVLLKSVALLFVLLVIYTASAEFSREYSPSYIELINSMIHEDDVRATSLSINSMFGNIGAIVGLGLIALISLRFELGTIMLTSAVLFLIAGGILLFLKK